MAAAPARGGAVWQAVIMDIEDRFVVQDSNGELYLVGVGPTLAAAVAALAALCSAPSNVANLHG